MRKVQKSTVFIVYVMFFTILFRYTAYGSTDIDTDRWAGENRYETAVQISKSMWNSSFYAVVASGENFPDALSAAPLAKSYNAPILLTERGSLNSSTRERLKELHVSFVYIVGGTGVIGENVEKEISNMGITVKRLEGVDRYDTSVKIAEQLQDVTEVVLATGSDFADAMSIAPIAARQNMPILLVSNYDIGSSLRTYAQNHKISKIYVMGDTESITEDTVKVFARTVAESGNLDEYPTVERITGKDKYVRNANTIKKFFNTNSEDYGYNEEYDYDIVYLATGSNYPDALAGAVVAAKDHAPIVLVDENDTNAAKEIIKAGEVTDIHILGSYGVVSNATIAEILKGDSTDSDDEVFFQDRNLEQAIRREIKKPSGKIMKRDLDDITKFRASFADIINLSGMENLVNLEELYLDFNSIRELYPLRNLTELESLSLNHNLISDITPISNLKDLDELGLYRNQIKDLGPLKNLNNLDRLDLRGNQIRDLYPLEDLSGLDTLYLNDNPVIDFTPISNYYSSLDNEDFDLNEVSRDPLSDFTASVDHISEKDRALIEDFEEKYNNSPYNMYKVLYHSFDNYNYDGDNNRLKEERKQTLDDIADVSNAKNINMLNEKLQDLNDRSTKLQREYEMNAEESILEGELNSALVEKERRIKRNKINLVYSQYMQVYYQNEFSLCTRKIGEKESLMQSLANNEMKGLSLGESDRIRARIDDLHRTVQILRDQKDTLEERKELYTDSYKFYNVIDCIFNNDIY